MTHPLATLLVGLLSTYFAIGAAFAVVFVLRGVGRIDPMARGAGWSFRLLIAPGSAIFWSLLLLRCAAGSVAPPVGNQRSSPDRAEVRMIRPLRRLHRVTVLGWWPLLPLLALAMWGRP
jgi:hypothetical protein